MKILESIRQRLDDRSEAIEGDLLRGRAKDFETYRVMTAELRMIQQIREDVLDVEKMYIED